MARLIPRTLPAWARNHDDWMDSATPGEYLFLCAKWAAVIEIARHDPEPLRRFLRGFLPVPREAREALANAYSRTGRTAAEVGAIGGKGKRAAEKAHAYRLAIAHIMPLDSKPSRASVVRAIQRDVLAYAERKGSPMSPYQVATTIDGWLKGWPEGQTLFAQRSAR